MDINKACQFSYLSHFCLQDGFVKDILQKPLPLCISKHHRRQQRRERKRWAMVKGQGKKFNINILLFSCSCLSLNFR